MGTLAGEETLQVLGKLASSGVATARILLQTFQTNRFEIARNVWPVPEKSLGWFAENFRQRVKFVASMERRMPGQKFIENRTQPVDIGPSSQCFGPGIRLFRGHILWRAKH